MPFSSLLRPSARRRGAFSSARSRVLPLRAARSPRRPLRGPLWFGGLLVGWVLSGWLFSGCQGEPSNLVLEATEVEVPAAPSPELAPGVVIDLGAEDGPAHLTE